MKAFRISMDKGDGRELFGQGETLCEAMANLIRAIDEYGDRSDKRACLESAADLLDYMPRPNVPPRIAPS